MPSANAGQVFSGPFSEKCLPEYQAAMQHINGHWRRLLNHTHMDILLAVADRTARFSRKWAYVPRQWFFDGHMSDNEQYAGCNPIAPISDRAFRKAREHLIALGILTRTGEKYQINYSITALDLAQNEDVQKRVLAENRRGGVLSTVNGLLEWAASIVDRLFNKPDKGEQGGSYTFRSLYTQENPTNVGYNASSFAKKVTEFFMGNRTATELAADITSSLSEKYAARTTKQKKRGTLSDLCNLFEQGWREGQVSSDAFTPPARILSRDRKLLKTQIINPFRESEVDPQAFALWASTNWDEIGEVFFTKTKTYPERPAFRWLVACIETYVDAYNSQELLTGSVRKINKQELLKAADKNAALLEQRGEADAGIAKADQDSHNALQSLARENLALRNELAATKQHNRGSVALPDYDDDYEQPKRKIRRKPRK